MTTGTHQEKLINQNVPYTLLKDGRFYIIENVPARVNIDTGEQLSSPQTVERRQSIIRGQSKPIRVIETPVYKFAA